MNLHFDENFKINDKLISLGFTEIEKQQDYVYTKNNNSERQGHKITIYLHECHTAFLDESICTTMSVYIDDDLIYYGMRPYTEDDFDYLFSNLFPTAEHLKKIQEMLSDIYVKRLANPAS